MVTSSYQPLDPNEAIRMKESISEHLSIFRTDADGLITYTNQNFLKMSGWTPKRILSKSFWQMFPLTRKGQQLATVIWNRLLQGKTFFDFAEKITRDGDKYYVFMLATPIMDGDQLQQATFIEYDATDEVLARQNLESVAYVDFETGLYSRYKLEQLVNESIQKEQHFSFVHLQIDYFATMKRQLDPESQRNVLEAFTNRLKRFFKDSPIARIGLNEFVVITAFADWFIEGFLEFLETQPIIVQPFNVPLTVSGGIAHFPEDQTDYDHLLEAASKATDRVAKSGSAQIITLSSSHHEEIDRKAKIYKKIPEALKNGKIDVLFQPIYFIKTNTIVSYEATIYWNDEELGLVDPSELIPLAQECGFIQSLGRFVLLKTIKELAKWRKSNPKLVVTLNASAREFLSNDMATFIIDTLGEFNCPPNSLQLEITERFAFQAEEEKSILNQMQRLEKEGVRFSLDDFGTGYSSFRYLQTLPISTIKINKRYVRAMVTHYKTYQLLTGIVQLAHSLDMYIVAEGVRTEEHFETIRKAGFDAAQGEYLCKPLRIDELSSVLQQTK